MTDTCSGTRKYSRGGANWIALLSSAIGLGIIALLVLTSQRERRDKSLGNATSGSSTANELVASGPHGLANEALPLRAGFVRVPTRAAPMENAAQFKTDPSDYSSQLVRSLTEVSLAANAFTPQQAKTWERNIENLIEQGTAAISPLREFLARNEDVRFDLGPGTNRLGEATLRIAFLKVLFDLPGPENLELQEQVLRTTADPDEIALLVSQLEQQEPGKYRELAVGAAQAALEIARNGALPGRDTSPLLKILEKYGATGEPSESPK